jgi:chromosomal replication initiator protein
VSDELQHIWSRVATQLAAAVDETTYRIWLEPLRIVDFDSGRLSLEASPQACGWVRERFGRVLQTASAAALGADVVVDIVPAGEQHSRTTTRPSSKSTVAPTQGLRAPTPPIDNLGNPKLTFDQFVIGDSNRLAHAAALTVAEMPAQAYNPLFLCGPPGVGKTHLLHSIANLLLIHNPGMTVRLTTSEAFANEFRFALGEGSGGMDGFKARFRHIDVLLIDDVQFLERKAKTEEEFFHTFNALYDAGSQIVLTSDRPPSDLQALEDRLRERFQAGLVADIRTPDFNTRLTILRKRAQHDGIPLYDDGPLQAIAERVALNVRAVEGALIRIVAFSSLTGRPLTRELAQEVLDGLYPMPPRTSYSIADIQAAACDHFGLSSEELLSNARTARITWPRHVAMYLAREMTSESLPAIGRHFGGRDHTTVLHAWRRTEERISKDSSSRHAVDSLRERLTHSAPDRPA